MLCSMSWRRAMSLAAAAGLFCFLPNRVCAGVTGALNGFVEDAHNAPVAEVKVSVTSPSQNALTETDQRGQFAFVSLFPDTYAVTASKSGYKTVTLTGVQVVSDNTRTILIPLEPVKTLGEVVVSRSGLLSAGTTQDVYSVNRPVQRTLVGLNGGYDVTNAYSSIAAQPGAFVPPIASGWNQPVFIRGGQFDEVGYEFDGIPVNRTFDNAPLTTLSTVGQQLLQVYTGGAPADAESHGLSGYINQVVRRGTYPGFADLTLSVGSPTLFNRYDFEAGGSEPNRRFSYFIGSGYYTQAFRYIDQSNGASFSTNFGQPFDLQNVVLGPLNGGVPGCGVPNGSNFTGCYANTGFFSSLPAGPGGYVIGPYPMGKNSRITESNQVGNFHFDFPSAHGTSDDVQLLYYLTQMYTYSYSSYNDWGGPAFWNGYDTTPGFHSGQVARFIPGFQFEGPLLNPVTGTLGQSPAPGVIPYFFPSAGIAGGDAPIPSDQEDSQSNALAITKVQYTHFFNPASYLRIYGFTSYSNWFTYSPNGEQQFYISLPADRELSNHQRGVSADYTSQLSTHNLFEAQASYTTGSDYSVENDQPSTSQAGPPWFPVPQTAFAALVSATAPTNGTCYFLSFPLPLPSLPGPPTATSCEPITPLPGPTSGFINQKFLTFAGPFFPAPPAGCGGASACEWLALENGPTGPLNAITPKFTALSVQDQWTPTSRWLVSLGLRWDRFEYDIPSTAGGPARAFWFNAWNNVMCVYPGFNGGNPIDETLLGAAPGTPCNTIPVPPGGGPNFNQATLTNSTANGATTTFDELQPRVGGTYTFDPFDVLRFSYGIYAQPPPSQFQYSDTLQQNLPAFIGPLYYALGDTTPLHPVRPQVSYDYDLSYEHRFNDVDTSFKVTPFQRVTRDQIQRFFINPTTGTVGGVNAGKQQSSGVEFQLLKGDFTHDGLSIMLSYTYTYSYITYSAFPNGQTLLSGVNASIQQYNSFTSGCASALPSASPTAPCGVFGGANALATEPSGVANPYFNAPARPLLNPTAPYPTYYVVPTGTQLSTASIGVPSFLALALSYKHDKYTIAPLVQYVEGSRYGAPQQQIGVDPSTCAPLAAAPPVASDARYPFGGTGVGYDATTCTGTLVIPDQFTGNFDAPGAFREPNLISLSAQLGYELSSKTSLRLTLTNLVTSCSGGTKMPWVTSNSYTCGYDFLQGHIPPAGNIFNPGDPIQPIVRYPYGAALSAQPFGAYLDVTFKV